MLFPPQQIAAARNNIGEAVASAQRIAQARGMQPQGPQGYQPGQLPPQGMPQGLPQQSQGQMQGRPGMMGQPGMLMPQQAQMMPQQAQMTPQQGQPDMSSIPPAILAALQQAQMMQQANRAPGMPMQAGGPNPALAAQDARVMSGNAGQLSSMMSRYGGQAQGAK